MGDSGSIQFRRVRDEAQLSAFQQCAAIGFQEQMPNPEQWRKEVVPQLDTLDFRIAVDGPQTVGTFLSFEQQLTAVGGARVPVRAVSAVTVLPTHRRRGILGTHMRECLTTAHANGAAAATLIAAEHAIYGRYGFGQSTETVDYRVFVDRSVLPDPPVDRLQFVDGAEYLAASTAVRESLDFAGAVSKLDVFARVSAGLVGPSDSDQTLRLVLTRSDAIVGVLSYRVSSSWKDNRPESTVSISELLGVDAAAERDLWSFAMSVDWVRWVKAYHRPLDDLVNSVPDDPRTVQVSNRTDFLWIRPLDVPALFSARTYAAPGRIVLGVNDSGFDGSGVGPAHGTFVIETEGGGGRCVRTDEPAELTIDVTELGRIWLSERPIARAVAAGAVVENAQGAAARADLTLFSPRKPWAIEVF